MHSSWQITKKSCLWIWLNKITLLLLLLPILTTDFGAALLELPTTLPETSIRTATFVNPLWGKFFLLYCLMVYFFSVAMVQIHRSIILSIPLDKMKVFPKPEKIFFMYAVVVILYFFLIILGRNYYFPWVASLFNGLLVIYFFLGLGMCVFVFIPMRLNIMFPVIALKKDLSYGLLITENRFWVIFKTNCMLIAPFLLAAFGISLALLKISEELQWFFNFLLIFKWALIHILYSFLFLEFSKPEFKRSS